MSGSLTRRTDAPKLRGEGRCLISHTYSVVGKLLKGEEMSETEVTPVVVREQLQNITGCAGLCPISVVGRATFTQLKHCHL